MPDFDKTKPDGSANINVGDDAIRDNMEAIEDRLGVEHYFPDNATPGRYGRHKFGSGGSAARDAIYTSPENGNVWWDTTNKQWQVYLTSATAWVPLGNIHADIKMVGRNPIDTPGWFKCDGREVAIASYILLHSFIGSGFDDNGVDPAPGFGNFRIPLIERRVPVGRSSGDPDFGTVGDYGDDLVEDTLAEANIPEHNHGSVGSHSHGINFYDNNGDGDRIRNAQGSFQGSGLTGPAGGHTHSNFGQASPTPVSRLQPFMVLGFKIYHGVY